MRNIGDKVWTARLKHCEFTVTCPDCLGTRAMTTLLENGDKHSLQCGTCYPGGMDSSCGYITKTQYQPAAREQEITGIEMAPGKTTYRFYDWSCEIVYDTEAEATAACEALRKEREKEDEGQKDRCSHGVWLGDRCEVCWNSPTNQELQRLKATANPWADGYDEGFRRGVDAGRILGPLSADNGERAVIEAAQSVVSPHCDLPHEMGRLRKALAALTEQEKGR